MCTPRSQRYAEEAGDAGLDSTFGEGAVQPNASSPAFGGDTVLIGPDDFNVNGPWPHECQGMQGTDSFYPYQLADGTWAGFAGRYSTAGVMRVLH